MGDAVEVGKLMDLGIRDMRQKYVRSSTRSWCLFFLLFIKVWMVRSRKIR